ncbi:MAG: ACT domain-containing protein [Candidatus Thorarchaeota archaeon]
MVGISNLKTLLRLMNPVLIDEEFVFCTISEIRFFQLEITPLLMFREKEGISLILKKGDADLNSLDYTGVWSWIILSVHSDLAAIGLLAAITNKFAKSGISVNVVSAFFHDHLFVPLEQAHKAMILLEELSSSEV